MKCCQRQIGHHLRVLLLLISEIVAPLIVPGGRGVVLPKQNSSLTRVSQGLSIQRELVVGEKASRLQKVGQSPDTWCQSDWKSSGQLEDIQTFGWNADTGGGPIVNRCKDISLGWVFQGAAGQNICFHSVRFFFVLDQAQEWKNNALLRGERTRDSKFQTCFFSSWNQQYLQRISKQNYVGVQELVGPCAS